jgi:hypothetical protein
MRCELHITAGKPERCGKPALFLWLAIVRKYAICADCASNPYIDARDLELLPEVEPRKATVLDEGGGIIGTGSSLSG